jgi:hypothetical protein
MTNFIATSKLGFDQGFERWDDSFAQGHEGSTSPEALARLLELADELRTGKGAQDEGLFLFAWLFEPHYRYEAHDGLRFGPGFGDEQATPYRGTLTGDEALPDLQKIRAGLGLEDKAFLRGRYQSEVAFVDRSIGAFIEGLKKRGLYDDALVVVAADHGEEILDRGWIGHTVTLHESSCACAHRAASARRRGPPARRARRRAGEPDRSARDDPRARDRKPPDRAAFELGTAARSRRPCATGLRRSGAGSTSTRTSSRRSATRAGEPRARVGVLDAKTRRKWIVDHKVGEGERRRPISTTSRRIRVKRTTSPGTETTSDGSARSSRIPRRSSGAPERLPEEPWTHRPGAEARTLDGAGPALIEP